MELFVVKVYCSDNGVSIYLYEDEYDAFDFAVHEMNWWFKMNNFREENYLLYCEIQNLIQCKNIYGAMNLFNDLALNKVATEECIRIYVGKYPINVKSAKD